MPNKLRRHKRGGSRIQPAGPAETASKPDSVKELLARLTPTLTQVSRQTSRQTYWRQWLAERLPTGLAARLSGVVERGDTLVVFAESAAWSARLRYAVQELEAQIKACSPAIRSITVRVLPR